MTEITDLNIPSRIKNILDQNGFQRIEELIELCRREVGILPGIGSKSLDEIENALAERGISLAEDMWGPYTCARHSQPSMDTSLRSLFLCDDCARDFQNDAFNREDPAYVGIALKGYCSHCNRLLDNIRIRQWYLCGVCDRVVRSIGRSVVADSFFHEWWIREAKPYFPHLELFLTDPPELRPRNQEGIEAKVSQVDFTCINSQTDEPLFGIELKTGRSHLPGGSIGSKMQQFQLDNSDCDDILAVVSRENLPVYLVHAQVIDRATPPTIYYAGVGLWWTDLFSMQEYFTTSRTRPRETRIAAYYNPKMFRMMDDFVKHLNNNDPESIKRRLDKEGLPKLY